MLLQRQQQLAASSRSASSDHPLQLPRSTAAQFPDDPRLKWARPEWLKPQHDGGNTVPAAPHTANSSRARAVLKPKQQTLLNRVTYGSHSIDDSEYEPGSGHNDISSSRTSSLQENDPHPQLYQALGIDFGAQRVGIAVRRSNHNVPLLTLHRQQRQHLQSSGHRSVVEPAQQQQQQSGIVSLRRTAAAILHLALQEGCDGFIVGLPVYNNQQQQQQQTGAAAARMQQQEERRLNSVIRTFALRLAELAVPMQLTVLLVNEQQSSQQARAVMSGAAAYDVRTADDLEQQQHQQQEQQEGQASKNDQQQQINRRGRDAFAAALILSRYYNGLVQPIEQVVPQEQPSSSSSNVEDPQATASRSNSSRSSSSSSNSSCCWGPKQQRQAAADLKLMMTPPGEQRRWRKQRERISAAAIAVDT